MQSKSHGNSFPASYRKAIAFATLLCALPVRADDNTTIPDAHAQGLDNILPEIPLGGIDARLGEIALNIPTAFQAAYNSVSGFYRRVPVTVEYEGRACTIPFTFHKDVFGTTPTLMLHGLTDSGESYHPYVKRAKKGPGGNRHFVMVDWPRNGNADCGQAMTVREAAEATALAYEAWMKQLNHYASTNHLSAIGQPQEIIGHSMGTIIASHLITDPKFNSLFKNAKATLLAVPALERGAMKRDIVDYIKGIKDKKGAAEFLKRTQTSWAHPMIDLAQASPLFGTHILKWITGAGHLGRIDRNKPYVETLFAPADPNDPTGPTNYDMDLKAILALDPAKTSLFLGSKDRLTPPKDLDPAILDKFENSTSGNRVRRLDCGHNIQRDCDKALFRQLNPGYK